MSCSEDFNNDSPAMLPMEGKVDEDGKPYPRLVGGGRTKQTARKCTGGPPPRKQPLFWESMARSANMRTSDEDTAGNGSSPSKKGNLVLIFNFVWSPLISFVFFLILCIPR